MKRYSTSLIVSEMQIQTTARYHLMLVRMAIIKMTANNKCWKVLVAQVMFDSFFATPWTVACQAPLSMRFSRQEYWSGLPFPSSGHLPDPGIKPRFPVLQADSLPSEPPGKLPTPWHVLIFFPSPLVLLCWTLTLVVVV